MMRHSSEFTNAIPVSQAFVKGLYGKQLSPRLFDQSLPGASPAPVSRRETILRKTRAVAGRPLR